MADFCSNRQRQISQRRFDFIGDNDVAAHRIGLAIAQKLDNRSLDVRDWPPNRYWRLRRSPWIWLSSCACFCCSSLKKSSWAWSASG